jgi:hypothetical protein
VTSYVDATVSPASTYQVWARDAAGNTSPLSSPASVTTPAAAPAVFQDGFESGNLSAWTTNDGYARIYFNLVSYSSQVNVLRFRTSADASITYLFVNTAGKLGLRNDVGGTTLTNATSVGSDWHALELHVNINGASSTTEVWLDGVRVNDLSVTTNLGSTPIGRLQIGEVQSGRTYNLFMDDVVFDIKRIGL